MDRQSLRLLVVVAHPHDFTHCSGTCGIHVSMGDSVTVVSMSAGVSTHNVRLARELARPPAERDPAVMDMTSERLAAEKTEELRRAAALFGIGDVRVLDFPDHPFFLHEHPEAIEQLREIIFEVRPHVLITQSPYTSRPHMGAPGLGSGAHNDHNDTAYAVLEARAQAQIPPFGSTVRPHKIAATYYLGVYFEQSQVDFTVDVSEWHEQRVQAEATYVSQGHTQAGARRTIEVTLGNAGRQSGAMYAEPFVREGVELHPHLMVPDSVLRAAVIQKIC